ncbi:MAG: FlgB family protein [Marinicaulis sp.]|nr:FlgB family protein [Marinicaulis sp.]NNL90293.1 FlgB family protein [Marinicaulis sp.]
MINDLEIIKMASAMARHAATRHSVIAENIANADTVNYKAKDLEAFADAYHRIQNSTGKSADDAVWRRQHSTVVSAASPNGNTVSLEDQMMRSADAQQNHDAAITIYKKTIDLMRASLGRGN